MLHIWWKVSIKYEFKITFANKWLFAVTFLKIFYTWCVICRIIYIFLICFEFSLCWKHGARNSHIKFNVVIKVSLLISIYNYQLDWINFKCFAVYLLTKIVFLVFFVLNVYIMCFSVLPVVCIKKGYSVIAMWNSRTYFRWYLLYIKK